VRSGVARVCDCTVRSTTAAEVVTELGRSLAKVDTVNHDLTLSLELRDSSAERLVFELTFLNRSTANLLLPYPEIHGLRFGNVHTMEQSEWYTCILQSSDWAGFSLAPGQSRSIEYFVRPTSVESPKYDGTDYCRWSVDLPSGEYLVWFMFRVGEDYFCPDSHYRINDLRREAEQSNAVVWMGEVKSNRIQVTHAGRETAADT